jgi:hypothetical protein
MVVVVIVMVVIVDMVMPMGVTMVVVMIVIVVMNVDLILLGHRDAHGADHPADHSRAGAHVHASQSAPLHNPLDLLPDSRSHLQVGIDGILELRLSGAGC